MRSRDSKPGWDRAASEGMLRIINILAAVLANSCQDAGDEHTSFCNCTKSIGRRTKKKAGRRGIQATNRKFDLSLPVGTGSVAKWLLSHLSDSYIEF